MGVTSKLAKRFIMATERYSFSLTTFSPSGKLVQIEYALAAVAAGAPAVVIKAKDGIVLATEKKHKSILVEEHSIIKVEMVTEHIGMVYSGMGPDYRLLIRQARKVAQQYYRTYLEPIPTTQLVQRLAAIMQEYTQSGGVRPFGVSLLICGWDSDPPSSFSVIHLVLTSPGRPQQWAKIISTVKLSWKKGTQMTLSLMMPSTLQS